MQGILKSWNSEKGFGFIDDCFLHISKFNGFNMEPYEGMQIQYEKEFNELKGKRQVSNIVSIEDTINSEIHSDSINNKGGGVVNYLNQFDATTDESFAKSISYNSFLLLRSRFDQVGVTAIRQVYDSLLPKLVSKAQVQNRFALVGRQEERNDSNIPKGTMKYLMSIYEKVNEDHIMFKLFMETLIGFHKFISPNSKK